MFRSAAAILTLCLVTISAQASLLGRSAVTPGGTDYQAYYDTVLNITWLGDANLPGTDTFGLSGWDYDSGGAMSWYMAQRYVAAMNVQEYLGVTDWRLPTADAGCASGYYCTGNEMYRLFYDELGGIAGNSISAAHNANYNLFNNVQDYIYWTGTEYRPEDFLHDAYVFGFGQYPGAQVIQYESLNARVWAVSPGDSISAVPVPPAVWLFGSAFGLMGVMRRKTEV